MMELLVGEADEAIKTDVEVARELVTCRGLEAEGERLALVEVVERRTRICVHVIGIISCTEREHRAETKSKVPLTNTCMISNEERDIEEREGIIVATIIEVFCRSSFSHCAKS